MKDAMARVSVMGLAAGALVLALAVPLGFSLETGVAVFGGMLALAAIVRAL